MGGGGGTSPLLVLKFCLSRIDFHLPWFDIKLTKFPAKISMGGGICHPLENIISRHGLKVFYSFLSV